MDWDRVGRENRYRTGGTQPVAGQSVYTSRKNKTLKQKSLGFKAQFKSKCPNCRKPILPGQMIVKFPSMGAPVHRRCL